ncbi:hypothetical protein CAC42_1818 [Sphaceloma murrayae]|uniref:Uncharacterized protein n=1 Tax=Sphaceloma murrayae TaxID=2082308 RepID=A0A2K1QVJ8_9PEZI|nr:hypothetical protein CAC42_1818 [Sphaceloma murrayae]
MARQSVVPDTKHGTNQVNETDQGIFQVVKELPFELREHVGSYLQEELYTPAFTLLQNLLVSGADQLAGSRQRIYLPSPQIIALASTLIVYPPLTTRLSSRETPVGADLALRYFQHLSLASTLGYDFAGALTFASSDSNQQSRRRRRQSVDGGYERLREIDGHISTKVATSDCIYERAEDFWQVIGWAFNCSVRHEKRWQRWRIWLDTMLDLLETDLDWRLAETARRREVLQRKTNEDAPGKAKGSHNQKENIHRSTNGSRKRVKGADQQETDLVAEALLTKYLTLRSGGRGEKKRIIRAIFANGSKQSMSEFKEIWKNETKPPKEASPDRKPERRLDVQNDEWGDYMDMDDDDAASETQAQLGRRRTGRHHEAPTKDGSDDDDSTDELDESLTYTIADYGGISSILLRQRVLGLLVKYVEIYPIGFVDTIELFDLCTEIIRPLPLHTFLHFVTPSAPYIANPHAQGNLLLDLLRVITGREPKAFKKGVIDQDDLEQHYLPVTASQSNAVDNAKVSVMVEALMRLLWKEGALDARESLREAAAEGRTARLDKVKSYARRKTQRFAELAEEAQDVLTESSKRIAVVVDVVFAAS